ncbi:MAG: hypothetical protein SV186_01605 [Candidatus Nanohaloarchaea archaeon]|nr:hypothetical protein [Candidatus Nanohaloarchaea archaeon]
MDPDRVLDTIKGKESISFIEAERGLLASFLRAEQRQVERNPRAVAGTFGDYGRKTVENLLRDEFTDLLSDAAGETNTVDHQALTEAVERLGERISIEEWDDDIVKDHRDTCETIIDKARDKSR